MRAVPLVHELLQVMAGNQFVVHGRAGEVDVVAAQTHQLVPMLHPVGREGDDDRLATEEVGTDLLSGGGHHLHAPRLDAEVGDRDQVTEDGELPEGAAGRGGLGLKELVEERLGEIDARAVNSIPLGEGSDGVPIVARVGRYGPYLERGDGEDRETASIPEDLPPDELSVPRAIELLEAPSNDRVLGVHPDSGLEVHLKAGRFGPYVQEGEHDDETGFKPRTASLFKSMEPRTVTLEDVLPLLALPREVGVDPSDGEVITAQNGRYGPYLKKGTDSRSIDTEEQILTIDLDECLKIFAEPKRRRGQKSTAPLRELGPDPDTERPIVVKDGRFGPYVTDGEYNASLRKGDAVEEITMERAMELLAERRAKGPAKKKSKKRTPAKKKASAKKKSPAKKKAPAKKKSPARKKAAADSSSSMEADGDGDQSAD